MKGTVPIDARMAAALFGEEESDDKSALRIAGAPQAVDTRHVIEGAIRREDGRLYGVAQEGRQFARGTLFRLASSGEGFNVESMFARHRDRWKSKGKTCARPLRSVS